MTPQNIKVLLIQIAIQRCGRDKNSGRTCKGRAEFVKDTLKKIKGRGHGFAVFWHAETNREILFYVEDEGFLVDIPGDYNQLTDDEAERIPREFKKLDEGNDYQRKCSLGEAPEIIEQFYREVCSLPEGYELGEEHHPAKRDCDFCGKTVWEDEMGDVSISVDEARRMGYSKDKIWELVMNRLAMDRIKSIRDSMLENKPQVSQRELDERIMKDGPIHSFLCSKCAKKHESTEKPPFTTYQGAQGRKI